MQSATELLVRAENALTSKDEIHRVLFQAFKYRIDRVLKRISNKDPLPETIISLQENKVVDKRYDEPKAYYINRLRFQSRILERYPLFDLYNFREDGDVFSDLRGEKDKAIILKKILAIVNRREVHPDQLQRRTQLLSRALTFALRVDKDIVQEILPIAFDTVDTILSQHAVEKTAKEQEKIHNALIKLFDVMVNAIDYFDLLRNRALLLQCVDKLTQTCDTLVRCEGFAFLLNSIVHFFRKFDRKRKLAVFIDSIRLQFGNWDLDHRLVNRVYNEEKSYDALQVDNTVIARPYEIIAQIASAYNYLRRRVEAEILVETIRRILYSIESDDKYKEIIRKSLACLYIRLASHNQQVVGRARLEEVFCNLDPFPDSLSSARYYQAFNLAVVEAAVLAAIELGNNPIATPPSASNS